METIAIAPCIATQTIAAKGSLTGVASSDAGGNRAKRREENCPYDRLVDSNAHSTHKPPDGVDFCEIDRRPCKGDAPRLREQIALIHVAQIERVHGRGGMGAAAARRLRADGQSVAVLQGGTCCFLGENYIELTPNLIHRFKCL